LSRHLLVLAGAYSPWPNAAATRARGFARGLAESGYEVTVVTAGISHGPPIVDPGVEVEAVPWLDLRNAATRLGLRRTPLGRPRLNGGGTRPSALTRLAGNLAVPDLYFSWIPSALVAARRHLRKDSVLYSTGPVSGHIVARLVKGDRPWVADVNDLWWGNPFREPGVVRDRVDHRLERLTLSAASALTTVNDTIRQELAQRFARPARVVWSGFDPEEFPERRRPLGQPARLLFTGTLYPSVDLGPLLDALDQGRTDGFLSPELLEVVFIGGGSSRLALQAEGRGLASFCQVSDLVPRPRVLQELVDADALLLPVYPEQKDIMPMRFFEYVGSGRPILALGPKDGLAARTVEEHRLGVPVSTAEEILELLRRLTQDPLHAIPVSSGARDAFSWSGRVKELKAVLDEVAELYTIPGVGSL
jgi:glycosyltransferase involved in cell wall biosynthesis